MVSDHAAVTLYRGRCWLDGAVEPELLSPEQWINARALTKWDNSDSIQCLMQE